MRHLPLISICIPTYNRANYLQECLDCIIAQESFDIESIEIVISDNASIDNTPSLVARYQKNYRNIHYFRNTENVGANLNLFRVAENAKGTFIWFMGDDDCMLSGSLKRVLHFLAKYDNLVLIQANMLKEGEDVSFVKDGVDYWKKLITEKKANKLSVFLLFLSMVIVRRESFIYHLDAYRKSFPHKLKESFSHFYVLIRCINQSPILLVGDMIKGGDGDILDKTYFKNSSRNWYNLVIRSGIDKLSEDSTYLLSIGISEANLIDFRANFVKIYRYMQIGDILKYLGLYKIFLSVFRKFFLKKL